MQLDTAPSTTAPSSPSRRSRFTVPLLAVVASRFVIAGTGGWLLGHRGSSSTVASSSVDAGFSRDMSTHHQQGITMASYTRDRSSDARIKILARDIETGQYFQIGQMQGWLDGWGLSRSTTNQPMSWMSGHDHLSADGLMPGMATPEEMDRLETLTGAPLDTYFLQLMIRHHQGGIPMAHYAAAHAATPYVRNLAEKIVQVQGNEIVEMEQMLRERGGSPLPPPTH